MDGIGVIIAIAFSLLYPLIIWLLLKKVRFEQESYRYLFAAFLLGAVVFYLAYLRKFYVLFISGYALWGVDLLGTGFIEEAVKLLVLIIPFIKVRLDERNGAFYGLAVGLGFGAGEAVFLLAPAAANFYINQILFFVYLSQINIIATMALTPLEVILVNLFVLPDLLSVINSLSFAVFTPSLIGLSLIAVFERMFAVLFHASSAAIIGYGLVRGKTLKFYLIAVILHITFNLFAFIYAVGLIGIIEVEILLAVFAIALFVYVIYRKVLAVD